MSYFAQGHSPSSPFLHSKGTPGLESSQCSLTLSPSFTVWLSSFFVKTTWAADKEITRSLSTVQGQEWRWRNTMRWRRRWSTNEEEKHEKMTMSPSYHLLQERLSLSCPPKNKSSILNHKVSNRRFVAHNWVPFLSFGTSLHNSGPQFPSSTRQEVQV